MFPSFTTKRVKAVLTLLCLIPQLALAGYSHGNRVNHIMVHVGDVVFFDVGLHHNKPACSTSGEDWAVSLSTEKGRAMYALLLSAAAQKQAVYVQGSDVCDVWGDRETPKYIWVVYPE